MSTMVEIPGVGEVEFPDGMSQQQIAEAARRLHQQRNPSGTTGRAVAAGAGEQMLGNLSGLINLPNRAINAVTSMGDRAQGAIESMLPEALRSTGTLFPGPTKTPQLGRIPAPSGRDLAAGIESPIQAIMAGQSLSDAFRTRMETRSAMERDRPGAFGVGELLGDAGTLATGRAPMIRQSGGLFDEAVAGGVTALSRGLNPQQADRGFRALLARVTDSDAVRSVARGAGRTAEAGLESTALAMLQDRDPWEMAGISMGAQAAGSVSNSIVDELIGSPGKRSLKRAGISALIGTVGLQLLKSGTPGGEDAILESMETNFSKVALGTLMGLGVGLAGRRGSANAGTLGRDFPRLADALTTIPRSGVLQLAKAAADDAALERAMQNVGGLGESDAKRFMSIVESDDPAESLREWMRSNDRVRRILSAPDPRLAGVRVKEET